ncbi:MAG: FKBP-type peptidyl-prolyl cis-trans isomerase [Sumerlaeia bacterium]
MIKKTSLIAALSLVVLSTSAFAENASVSEAVETLKTQTPTLETLDQKASYMLGARHGKSMANRDFTLDVHAYLKGLENSIEGKDQLMTQPEMQEVTRELDRIRREVAKQKQDERLQENLTKAEDFLAENKSKEGVITTASGLQYKVLTEGEGKSPTASSNVTVHYKGSLMDGTEFDSSYKRNQPTTFNASQVIKGWTEGLQLMKPGAKYEFYIHPELAYGEATKSTIPANSLLIFEVELLEIK